MLKQDLIVVDNDAGLTRADWNTPMADASFNYSLPLEEQEYPTRQGEIDEVKHCRGRFVITKRFKRKFYKMRLIMAVTANMLGIWEARARGAATAPAGTQTNEVQTLTVGGDSNNAFKLAFTSYGTTEQTSEITGENSALFIQNKLEKLDNIGKNVTVTGTGPFVITFKNKLGFADLPLLTVLNVTTSPGDVTIAQTTAGSSRQATITESTNDQRPVFDLKIGDYTNPNSFVRYNNCAVTSLNKKGTQGEKVIIDVELYAASIEELGFYMPPACIDYKPIYTQDCSIEFNGAAINNELVDFDDTYNLNLVTDEDAYPFNSNVPYQWEANNPEYSTKLTLKGDHTDPIYKLGMVDDDEETGVSTGGLKLILGKPGARVTYNKPYGFVETDSDGALQFAGSKERSRFGINFTPTISNDEPESPETITVFNGQATAYLV